MPKIKPDFPEVLDNSMRSAFVACPRKFYYQYIKHLISPKLKVDLFFGACMAKAIETTRLAFWRDGKGVHESVSLGSQAAIAAWGDEANNEDDLKNLYSLLDAHFSYFTQYPLGQDRIEPLVINGRHMIECSFAVPIPKTKHPQTGKPIIYAGRFDLIGVYGAANFIVDEKTTKSLGASWSNQWKLRAQFTGYAFGARTFGIPIDGAIVRGIGILKRDITFAECIETRTDWEINRWLKQLQIDIGNMISSWKKGYWNYDLSDACSSFRGCDYIPLCTSEHPERWENQFIVKNWNPLEKPL